ncbi:MAG: hypothetical protein MJ150_05320, partial [Clostridia bacterium]|nr:hypothetical protein [Clostridia bacterium]
MIKFFNKSLITLLAISMILSFSACSKKEDPLSTESGETQEQQKPEGNNTPEPEVQVPVEIDNNYPANTDDLFGPKYLEDLNAYDNLSETIIVDDGSAESKFVLAELHRIAKDDWHSYEIEYAKDYKTFAAYSINIDDKNAKEGVKIYRLEYGFNPKDSKVILPYDCEYDGSYYRRPYINFLVAAYDDEGFKTIRFVSDYNLRNEYSTEALLSKYTSPYRAAAMELYDWHLEVKNLVIPVIDYAAIFSSEENIAKVKEALMNYYNGNAEIDDIAYYSYTGYDEGSYVAYKVSIKKSNATDFEKYIYIVSYDLEGVSDIIAAEIPEGGFADADSYVVEEIMNLFYKDASIRIDPYGFSYGPGSNTSFFGFPVAETKKKKKMDWSDAIFTEGSYWFTVEYKNFKAVCYYEAESRKDTVYEITTSRSDICTYRGTRVGDSVDKLKELYPELILLDKNMYVDEYHPGGDIYFFDPSDPENSDYGFGINVVFYCDNGKVSAI